MTNMTTDDPKALLDLVARKQRVTRERLQLGVTDFLLVVLAIGAAAGITGAYRTEGFRPVGIVLTIVSAVFTTVLLRSRKRLGGEIPVATWVIPAVVFVADLAIGFTVHGTARDASVGTSAVAAAVVLGLALHSRFLIGLGAALAAIFVVGIAAAPGMGSYPSFGLGIAFGIGVAVLNRKRLAKR